MTYLAKARYLTDEQIVAEILAIPKTGFKPNPNTGRVWSPVGVYWHNTGNPSDTLRQTWNEATWRAWGDSLNAYYRGLGWHAGPHACGSADAAIQLGDWQADGIHCTCGNETFFGVETLLNAVPGGDDPKSGRGLKAMQSSAAIIAALCARFEFDPKTAIRFHRECTADHHACPGALVESDWAIGLVEAKIAEIKGSPIAPVAPPPRPEPIMPAAAPSAYEPASDPVWIRAAEFVAAMRAKGFEYPAIVGGLANVYAESRLRPEVVGDDGTAVNIVQWHGDRAARIRLATGVDVAKETSISRIVDAIAWELANFYAPTLAKLKAATTAEDAARIWCAEYEGAGAAGAADRRAAFASYFTAWVALNAAFIAANSTA